MADLKGKVALITGAAHPQGIGRAIAEHLGKQGARILIGDIDRSYMDSAVEDLTEAGIQSSCYDMDVSDMNEVEKAVRAMVGDAGGIDILINNVGGTSRVSREEMTVDWSGKTKPKVWNKSYVQGIANSSVEQWHKIINVNLNSVYYCSKAVLPYMMERKFGRIVNFASIAGQRGITKAETYTSGPYAVAKAAVIGFTRQLALETAEFGINVNAVSPGLVRSGRGQAIESLPKEQYDVLIDSIPLGRIAETEEVADVVLALCSDTFKYVTGQTINVNGGMFFG